MAGVALGRGLLVLPRQTSGPADPPPDEVPLRVYVCRDLPCTQPGVF